MHLLDALVSIFINVFGITQPTDKQRRQASWFILTLLILSLVAVATVGILISHIMRH